MITASNSVKNILKEKSSIKTSAGARIEYNLNSMVYYIKAESSGTDHALSGAFKKLFPIDTIYKPFRPVSPGIKYLIYTDNNTDTPANSFESRSIVGMSEKPRLYYPGNDMYYKYWVSPKNEDISISLEYFSNEEKTNKKNIPFNKVIARFENNHDTPSSWEIKATKEDGTEVSLGTGTSLNSSGEAIVYYNGTSWSSSEPTTYLGTQYFNKISLFANNSNSGKLLGVIELSPRWVVEIDNDVESFEITKETGADDTVVLPVGTLTANSLSLSINKFKQDSLEILEYNRDSDIDNTKVYLFKNSMIYPYINIKDGVSDNKIRQGTFYMHSWEIDEFGRSQIRALDGAKILQETLCPEVIVQDAPVTSSIKRILDSIGFSNYYINVKKDENDNIIDNSIPTLRYWWSDAQKTVWEALQELCRDIQMNAFIDENNILNFYTRDYIYDSDRDTVWKMSSEEYTESYLDNGQTKTRTVLPNIASFSSRELASANEVKIRYSTPITSEYDGSSSPLWKSEETFLGAGGLSQELSQSELEYFNLEPTTIDTARSDQMLYSFNGYVLINTEVIEFDGVEYQYTPIDSNTPIPVIIKNSSDIYKYRSLSKSGAQHFKPTGRYKIKSRGALNTDASSHPKSPTSYINDTPNADATKFNKYSITISTPADATAKPGTGSYTTPANGMSKTIAKSFLTLSNLDQDKRTYDIAIKSFNAIDLSKNYFSFGTRMFFDSQFNSPEQAGGISFFTSPDGTVSYFLIIRTTAFAGLKKDILIVKQYNAGANKGKVKVLKDSQGASLTTLAGIYSGQAYNVDVLVKKDSNQTNYITIFINGFKITAQDSEFESGNLTISPTSPTKNVGLMCGQGVVYFEYVYAKSIEEDEYNVASKKSGFTYNGVYSDDTMSLLYGDLIFKTGETANSRKDSLVEFGTTAREIRKAKVFYTDKPAFPIKFSTAKNKYATVLDTRLQPFSAETYVLNNTSTTIPLDDGNYSSFYVLGNSVYKSSPLEYSTYTETDSTNKEPVIFESNWIQSESDAKSLADWIKSTVLNKGRLIDISMFANPLISPGDLITINYPMQGLDGESQKFIVTRVRLSYSEGVSAELSCRAI